MFKKLVRYPVGLKWILYNAVVLLSIISIGGCKSDEEAIRKSFKDLQVAMQSGDGQLAAKVVCQDLLDYYDDIKKKAIGIKKADLEKESQLKVVMILQMRYFLSRAQLVGMSTGRELFEWNVNNGYVQKSSLSRIKLDKIKIEKDLAYASVSLDGSPVEGNTFTFKKESGTWKFDLMKLIMQPHQVLEQIRRKGGYTKAEVALYLMEKKIGNEISLNIFDHPLK